MTGSLGAPCPQCDSASPQSGAYLESVLVLLRGLGGADEGIAGGELLLLLLRELRVVMLLESLIPPLLLLLGLVV